MANAASGMAVDDDCKLKFLELKAKRSYRFIVFKIEEKQKQVIVEKLGEPNLTYEDFAASLPINECRYCIYDFDFVTEENCQKARSSSSHGPRTRQRLGARCCMQAPKIGSRGSLMVSRWSYKRLIQLRWALM